LTRCAPAAADSISQRSLFSPVNAVRVRHRNAQWIDHVSESLVADFLSVVPQTQSLVLITHRPDYRGALSSTPGGQTISLASLNDSESAILMADLLGRDPSVDGLTAQIAERAAGNPFFAQEIVRDLADRRVLQGQREPIRVPIRRPR